MNVGHEFCVADLQKCSWVNPFLSGLHRWALQQWAAVIFRSAQNSYGCLLDASCMSLLLQRTSVVHISKWGECVSSELQWKSIRQVLFPQQSGPFVHCMVSAPSSVFLMVCSKSSATVIQQLASLVFMHMCWLNLVFLLKQVVWKFLIGQLVKYNIEGLWNCYGIKV